MRYQTVILAGLLSLPTTVAQTDVFDNIGAAARSDNGGLTGEQPRRGNGEFSWIADGDGERDGEAITVQIGVEGGLAVDEEAFAQSVMTILNDDRGWSAVEDVQFDQVSEGGDVLIKLTSPETVDVECAPLDTGGYTSCRVGDTLVINVDRWAGATDDFLASGGDVTTYRRYVINHEMGHYLGYGHELECLDDGLAPVMMQQTLDMRGCQPNGWPGR